MAYKNKEQIKEKNREYRTSHKEYFKEYRKTHKEQIKKYNNKYYSSDKYRMLNREKVKEYRARNPLKYKARYTLRNAIVEGKIIKPKECAICGSFVKIEAHHHDYTKPLDIIWLCKICHRQEDYKKSMV